MSTKCVWCGQPLAGQDFKIPSKCKHKGKPEKQHKIHDSCWFGTLENPGFFAENGIHECPGCHPKRHKKRRLQTGRPVIDLTTSSRSSPDSHSRRSDHSPPRQKPRTKSKSNREDASIIDLTAGRRGRKTRRGRFGRKGKRRM